MIWFMGKKAEKIYSHLTIATPTQQETDANTMALFNKTVKAFEDYFNPRNNYLHYFILLSNQIQGSQKTNEEYIRAIYAMSSKCGFTTEENTKIIEMRLLADMKDKALSRELQVDTNITLADNQKLHQSPNASSEDRTVADVSSSRGMQSSRYSSSSGMASQNSSGSTTLKSQGRSRGEEEGCRTDTEYRTASTEHRTASTVEELMPEEDAQLMVNVVNNATSLITLLWCAELKRLKQ